MVVEAGFRKYYRTDCHHSFYPAGSREEAQEFETPWWLRNIRNRQGKS